MHSFANYPKAFKGTVISPTKICLQFSDVQVKLRRDMTDDRQLIKNAANDLGLPTFLTGTQVETSNMGCQLPTLEALQHALIDAYGLYGSTHSDRYREEYNKEFLDFLLEAQANLDITIEKLKKGKEGDGSE